MSGYPLLFEPIAIRGLTLGNRVVLPGMSTKMMRGGRVTDRLIDYHVARARGGSGLNMIEIGGVHGPSIPPDHGSLADDGCVPGYRRLADAIRAAGGRAGVVLWQGGLVAAKHPGVQGVAPSDYEIEPGKVVPGADEALLDEIADCYARAAARAVAAGMDVLELHAGHGYLLHSFLSGALNRRTDAWGGSPERRMAYPLRIVRAVRAAMPEEMPLFLRIDALDDYLEGGLTVEETIAFVREAGRAGVDVADVSRGNELTDGIKYVAPTMDIPYAFNADNAARIRAETGVLTMAVGRINGAQLCESLLKEGKADLIGVGRVQIADPEFCNKAQSGDVGAIERCIGCNQGCFDAHFTPSMPHITCLRNPAAGREREFAILPAPRKKTVLVVGGGPAGMEAACTLAKRGHAALLLEATDRLGGQFYSAGQAPRKGEVKAAMIHKALLTKRSGADMHLGTPLTPKLLEEIAPDAVIDAAGAYPSPPRIPGADGGNVFLARDVLDGKHDLSGRVAIIGGGMVGLEVCEFLAERGCAVAVLEMMPEVGAGLGNIRRICAMENIAKLEVTLLTGARCMAITAEGVDIELRGEPRRIEADAVVIAIGSRPVELPGVEAYCAENGIAFYPVGDAVRPRRALDAIYEAGKAAREI